MAFVDELKIHAVAGKGGDGVVRWRHEKFKEWGGPSGGNGGRGGDVYVVGVRDAAMLAKYRHEKLFKAQDGEDGRGGSEFGAGAPDFDIEVPVGSVVTNLDTGMVVEVMKEGERIKILTGGRGGLGNEYFKSSTNINPFESTDGKKGEEADFLIEVRLIADAGFIGLPSAGKSSLLNAVTGTNVKVGAYHFTTLEPNLGAMHGTILADIPGLIEGAHEGKGLGHKFLRHITRTKILAHCVSLESEDMAKDYKTVRSELEQYQPELIEKPELVIFTKSDVINTDPAAAKKEIASIAKKFAKETGVDVGSIVSVSIYDDAALKELSDTISQMVQKFA